MPRETPWQVPVRVGVLLWRALQSAIHDTEGGYEVLARARGRGGGAVALCRSEPSVYQLVPQIGAHLYEIALRVMHENKMILTRGGVY